MCTSLRNFCCRQLQKKQNIFDPPWRFFSSFFATLPDFVGFTFTSFKYDWKEFWSQPKHACKWQLQSTLHCITVPNITLKVTLKFICIKLYCYIFCQKLHFAKNFINFWRFLLLVIKNTHKKNRLIIAFIFLFFLNFLKSKLLSCKCF